MQGRDFLLGSLWKTWSPGGLFPTALKGSSASWGCLGMPASPACPSEKWEAAGCWGSLPFHFHDMLVLKVCSCLHSILSSSNNSTICASNTILIPLTMSITSLITDNLPETMDCKARRGTKSTLAPMLLFIRWKRWGLQKGSVCSRWVSTWIIVWGNCSLNQAGCHLGHLNKFLTTDSVKIGA